MSDPRRDALSALADCEAAVAKLDKLCCEPGRSPRIAVLARAIEEARRGVGNVDGTADSAHDAIALLEEAGGRTGSLQVGCCAPARLPLYRRVLENLTNAQRAVNEAVNRGH